MSNRCTSDAMELTRAVDGYDWDAGQVERCCQALYRSADGSSEDQVRKALEVLIERIARFRVEDADGTAHVAITAGALVERGQDGRKLGEVLLQKLPMILKAARRFADTCLAKMDPKDEEDEEEEVDEKDVLTYVDSRPIMLDMFRSELGDDHGGGAALAYLREWVMPAVAVLSRDRGLLLRAVKDSELRDAVDLMRDSSGYWLSLLLGVELDARWLVLCPLQKRGFELMVDGVVSNFDLHALVADRLTENGIPGERNPPGLIAFLRGESPDCRESYVAGSFNFYDFRAARFDIERPDEVPHDFWVWNEGRPSDVPKWEGSRTLLAGPPQYERTWNKGRAFAALRSSVSVERELSEEEVRKAMERARQASIPASDRG